MSDAETERGGETGTDDPAGESLLAVRGLDAGYGDLQILDGVDLDVAPGEYVTVVGLVPCGRRLSAALGFGVAHISSPR